MRSWKWWPKAKYKGGNGRECQLASRWYNTRHCDRSSSRQTLTRYDMTKNNIFLHEGHAVHQSGQNLFQNRPYYKGTDSRYNHIFVPSVKSYSQQSWPLIMLQVLQHMISCQQCVGFRIRWLYDDTRTGFSSEGRAKLRVFCGKTA